MLILLLALVAGPAVLADYQPHAWVRGTLRCTGSETMELLVSRWAEAFARWHPAASVEIDGRGSRAAVQVLSQSGADFAALSRSPTDTELRMAGLSGGLAFANIGWDTLRLFRRDGGSALPDLPSRLFSGEPGPWRPFGRNLASGTRAEAGTALGAVRFGPQVRSLSSPGRVEEAVAADPMAVGYGGGGWGLSRARSSDMHLRVRSLILAFPNGRITPLAREFLSFVLSRQGQDLVRVSGFQPLETDSVVAMRRRFAL